MQGFLIALDEMRLPAWSWDERTACGERYASRLLLRPYSQSHTIPNNQEGSVLIGFLHTRRSTGNR